MAHEMGLFHKTVVAEVVNSRREYLLVRQSSHKQDPGQYVSPVGGHIKAGEAHDGALKREAEEEIGVTDFSFKHLGNLIVDRETRGLRENRYFIVYEIQADVLPVLNDESDAFVWMSRVEIEEKLLSKSDYFGGAFIPVWEKFYNN